MKIFLLIFLLVFTTMFGCSSDEEKKVAFLEKGKAYFEKGEYKSAELELKNAIQIDSKYIEAHTKLGETQLKLGNPQGAFQSYSIVAQLDPDNTNAQLKLATFYLLGNQLKESRKKVDAILSKEPNNLWSWVPLTIWSGMDEAEKAAAEVLRVQPAFCIDFWKKVLSIDEETDRVRLYTGALRKAGIPEHPPSQ